MRFSPASIAAKEGETIRFLVKNSGQVKHEFVLGTEKELKAHDELMKKFPEMEHSDPQMVTVSPGKTGEVIWRFTRPGKIDFACLQPGHYDAGMKGAVNVAADMADGEVRKVDKDNKKITLKHGAIKNLDMPGMTMVFQVKDPAMLDAVKPGDQVKFSAERLNGAIVLTELKATAAPSPELIHIQWDATGQFSQPLTVAPARFVEVCGKLAKGQSIVWSFDGQVPLNFNIHYHEGQNVVFPAKQDGVASLSSTLSVPLDQDYCWMWENKASAPAVVALKLKRS
jgi:Cu/Ag efflux protein CusF